MSARKSFLVNITRKTVLAQDGKIFRSPFTMALGAMFRGLPGSLVFVWHRDDRIAITNLFVFEDLDVVWINRKGKIVHATHNFRKWSLHTMNSSPSELARYVIELPAGTLARSKTKVGDTVKCRDLVFS